MLTFRKKILLAYLLVFLTFVALMFPFSGMLVKSIFAKTMQDRADELLRSLQPALTDEGLVRSLKELKYTLPFRVSIITDQRKLLYDSNAKRLLGPRFTQEYIVENREVTRAFEEGLAFDVDYSDLVGEKFYYMAKAFDFHGKTYVLRFAVPYDYVDTLTQNFNLGFLALACAVLSSFSLMTWIILNYFTSPIRHIIAAITPYQQGRTQQVPEIRLKTPNRRDEFGQLADTLNSLSKRVQREIDTLIYERNEKEAILESLVEGVIAIDPDLQISYLNPMAKQMFDLTSEDLLNQPISAMGQPLFLDLLTRCQQEGKVQAEALQMRKEGRKAFYDVVAVPKGAGEGVILVVQDRSTHYRMIEMRKEFIANASHELKTPITIIRGFAEALHDNPDLPKATVAEVTTKIVKSCSRMTTLIKDLLVLADIENLPASRLIDCDIMDLLQGCRQTLLSVFTDAQVEVVNLSGAEVHMIADPSLLEMAFMNLLDNAAKYSNPPARIRVTVQQEDNRWIKISFADRGLGIPSHELENIFQRFYTVDKARSQRMGGSGLGLSIVETIIYKHYGTISVESKVGQGSTFTLLFPSMRI